MVCENVRCLYVPRDHIMNPPGPPLRVIPGFYPLPGHFPIYFAVIIPKISKKSKKLTFFPCPRAFFVTVQRCIITYDNLSLIPKEMQQFLSFGLLALLELFSTPESFILTFQIIKIGQQGVTIWIFPHLVKSPCIVIRSIYLHSPNHPSKCQSMDFQPPWS